MLIVCRIGKNLKDKIKLSQKEREESCFVSPTKTHIFLIRISLSYYLDFYKKKITISISKNSCVNEFRLEVYVISSQ